MTCFYLRETSENNKLKLMYKYFFNKIEIKDRVIEIPIKPKQKIKKRKLEKIVEKLKEINVRIAAMSIGLKNQEQLKKKMYSSDIDIIDGRLLFKILSVDILNYIYKRTKTDIKNAEISVLVNNKNELNKGIILDIAESVKTLNIVTNNISDFKDIENELYNERGIVIRIVKNREKSLLKSKIILNLDFCKEDINIFNIPKNSIIINTNNEIKIKSKKFNGIIINNYNIIIPNKDKVHSFNDEIIYESLILNKSYIESRKKIIEDKIKIINLIGEKGILHNSEFKQV